MRSFQLESVSDFPLPGGVFSFLLICDWGIFAKLQIPIRWECLRWTALSEKWTKSHQSSPNFIQQLFTSLQENSRAGFSGTLREFAAHHRENSLKVPEESTVSFSLKKVKYPMKFGGSRCDLGPFCSIRPKWESCESCYFFRAHTKGRKFGLFGVRYT